MASSGHVAFYPAFAHDEQRGDGKCLGSFGVMQCHSGDFEQFYAILVLFWAILGPPWVPEWPQGGPT